MVDLVTIIVPTKNEAENIGPFLHSIPDTISLIVVDDSEDETLELIANLRPKNTHLLSLPGNITEARQQGACQARTPWLLFTDADIEFASDYFELLPSLLAFDLIYGTKLSRTNYETYYRWFRIGQYMIDWVGIPAATGSNLLIRRDAFHAVGGFDLTLSVNEDSEIAWRVKRNGYRVHFAPNLIVYERDHRRLDRGVWRKTLHSVTRCALLYSGLLPEKSRQSDWGYWTSRQAHFRNQNRQRR